jgi:hypothetical protein
MNKFLDLVNIPRLSQETGNLNRPIMSKEIEAVIKSLLSKTSPGLHGFISKSTKTFKEDLNSIFSNYSKETKMNSAKLIL